MSSHQNKGAAHTLLRKANEDNQTWLQWIKDALATVNMEDEL